jgi:two-component system alkaline phosphatase synthesis response regulator PhoP
MTKKILIADDEQPLRLLVRATLGDEDYEILEASDGQETLEVARRERPKLLLLDIQMPEKNGFEVCEQLKSDPATADIVVVMLTVKSQQTDKERGRAVGADYYFTKPFSPLQLLQLVDRIMRED